MLARLIVSESASLISQQASIGHLRPARQKLHAALMSQQRLRGRLTVKDVSHLHVTALRLGLNFSP